MHIVQTIPLPLPFKISPLTPNIKKHYVLYTSFTPVYPLLTISSMQFKDLIKNLFEVCNTQVDIVYLSFHVYTLLFIIHGESISPIKMLIT